MIKAVIFDMDGTMVDSEPLHSKAYEQVLKEYGQEPVFNELGLVFTPGIKGWPGMVGKYEIDESFDVLTEKKRKIFKELINQIHPMPGFIKLVKFLKDRNYKLAVATSSLPESAEKVLEVLKLDSVFDAVCGTTDKDRPKPFPDVYLRAAKELDIEPRECLVFEDSETGILAGKAAQMKVVAVPSPYTKNQNFDQADKIIRSLNQTTFSLIKSL